MLRITTTELEHIPTLSKTLDHFMGWCELGDFFNIPLNHEKAF